MLHKDMSWGLELVSLGSQRTSIRCKNHVKETPRINGKKVIGRLWNQERFSLFSSTIMLN